MKRVNLQHSSYKHAFSKSIVVENNVDPDQTASLQWKPVALDLQCYQKGSSHFHHVQMYICYRRLK